MNDVPATTSRASLRRAVLIALVLGVLAWVAASFVIARHILVDSMIEHELDDGQAQGQRILRLVDAELARLARTAGDWAAWDETWAFARGEDPGYVERNIYDDVLRNLQLDLMAVVAADGNVRLIRMREADATPPPAVMAMLGRNGAWLEAHRKDRPLLGLLRTAQGTLAFVAAPIHRSSRGDPSPSAGTQVFARFIGDEFIGELRTILHAQLNLRAPDDPGMPDLVRTPPHGEADAIHVAALDEMQLVTHAVLRDLTGQPVAVIQAITPRTVHAQARRAERGLLLASLGIGLVAGLALYCFMSRRVLAPLRRLDAAVLDVARAGGRPRLPSSKVDDEFARLGRSVNAMLDELDSQHDAREARDAAQIASRLKGEMITRLAQTTTAPLAELKNALELALRGDDPWPEIRTVLDRAYRAAFQLATELRGLPELTRGTQIDASATSFELSLLIESIASAAATRAAVHGIDVVCDVDPTLAASYLGNPLRLQSVLNLMIDDLADDPTIDLLLRARLATLGTNRDSIEISVSSCPRQPGDALSARELEDTERATRLRQAVAALGGLLHSEPGRHQITVQLPRVDAARPGARPHAGRKVLLLGAPRVARDILEAYLKALGCQVATDETVTPTTPRDLALTVVLVDEACLPVPAQPPLPGVPTIAVLPPGSPPPGAGSDTAWLHRPLRWSALRAALDELWPGSPTLRSTSTD